MELNILKDEKNKIIIELEDKYATLAAAIKNELWNDKDTKVASLNKKHPLVGKPEIIVEGSNPRQMIKDAIERLQKDLDKFKKEFLKEC